MTMTLKLNENNDIMVGSRGAQYVSGPDEVKQRILVTLQHFYGEYFLAITDGVPWYELILGGKSYKLAEAIIRQAVINVPGVLGIMKFSMSFENRSLSIDMVVSVNGTAEGMPVFFDSTNLLGAQGV